MEGGETAVTNAFGGYVSRNLTFGHPCHVGVTKLASCTCPCSWLVLHVGPVNPHVPEPPTAVRFSGVPRGLRASGFRPREIQNRRTSVVFDRGALIRVATYGPSVFFWLCASRSRNAHHFLLTDAFGPIFISPGRRGDEDELFEGMRVCTATLLHSVGGGTPLLLRKPAHLINAPRASSWRRQKEVDRLDDARTLPTVKGMSTIDESQDPSTDPEEELKTRSREGPTDFSTTPLDRRERACAHDIKFHNILARDGLRREGGARLGGGSPGVQLGRSVADELALGCMSFYSGCYRSFVLEIFTTFIAYHAIVLLHTVRGPCSEERVLPGRVVAYRLYPCQVDRTIADSSMPVPGRLRCVGSVTLEI
ncbi:hypothetical protein BHM03_00048143 [Ensete ventricosum]|nr:hypothetical protein BHM03_00048143 [Ensete ventricosum]